MFTVKETAEPTAMRPDCAWEDTPVGVFKLVCVTVPTTNPAATIAARASASVSPVKVGTVLKPLVAWT